MSLPQKVILNITFKKNQTLNTIQKENREKESLLGTLTKYFKNKLK